MKTDLQIAQEAEIVPITDIAKQAGLAESELEPYGWYKAKVHVGVLERLKDRAPAKYIDVTAITPTPLGEGKTTTKSMSPRLESNSIALSALRARFASTMSTSATVSTAFAPTSLRSFFGVSTTAVT